MSGGGGGARRALRAATLGAYGATLLASAPPWPDDWDGVGFVEAVRDFDMARMRPHPPGYPVYVALLRVADAVVRDPMRACALVAALDGVVAIGLAWDAARRIAGERAAWLVAVLVGTAPLVWRACSGVGSESAALACAAACAWGLVVARSRPAVGGLALGAAAGLGLGVRLSWAPLYLPALAIAPRPARAPAASAAAVGCAAWLAPLAAVVGPRALVAQYAAHAAGHAGRWGGSVLTQPGAVRLAWLARDLFVDGFGAGADAPGIAVGALLAAAAAHAAWAARRAPRRWAPAALAVAVPYLVWIALGQNLREQPRHAVALVALGAAAVAIAAARSRAGLLIASALAAAMACRTTFDARARRTIPPPGAQLVELARAQPSPRRLLVMGGASVRFFETTELA